MRVRFGVLLAATALMVHAKTFRVSGTVVDSETGKPLDRTCVVLNSKAVARRVVTTGDGKFSFDVPEGKYTLTAAHRDWGDVYGEPVPGSNSGAPVIAGPNRDTTRVLFRFRAPISIYGKIVDENGDPVPSGGVEVFRQTAAGGIKRLLGVGCAESNDFGEYSYSYLPAGTYYMVATGAPWQFGELYGADEALTRAGTPPSPRAPVYYPNTTDANRAAPLVLRPGSDFRADFVLRPTSRANLLPACPEGNSCANGRFTLSAPGPGRAATSIPICDADCSRLLAIPPGSYVLRYDGPEGAARTMVDVHVGDNQIQVIPKPKTTLTGAVRFHNPTARPKHTLYVNFVDDDSGDQVTVSAARDGSFTWPKPTATHLRLYLSGSDGFFVESMSVEGAVMKGGSIDVAEGANVRITLAANDETGRLDGFVKENGEPVPAAMVILAPAVDSFDSSRYITVQSGTDGSYEFTQAPAGDYLLLALNDRELAYAETDALRPYLGRATRVRIDPRRKSIEIIGLVSPAR